MKINTILLSILIIVFSGCTQNNGDIGPWFGSWLLYEIDVDNTPDNTYSGNIVWAFQSSIIKMTVINSHHQTDEYWGTWEETDGFLTLNYTHSNAETAPGTNEYGFPPSIYLPANGIIKLQIIEHSNNRLFLEYTKTDGIKIIYRLHKQI